MAKPIAVEARDGYSIWVKFEDGVEGEVDLSDIAGRGVFKALLDRQFFETISILPHHSISWGGTDDLEICPDTIYMDITGLTVEDLRQKDGAVAAGA